MSDRVPPKNGDDEPWLTVHDVAQELRVHPQTVRMWIRSGRLRAARAGNEYRMRRTDVERALTQGRSSVSDARPGSPLSSEQRVAIEHVQLADGLWSAGIEASVNAPPDRGFAERLRAIADAAEQEAAAHRQADLLGLGHRPHPGAASMQLSYELHPGARSRRGRAELWERFDRAVAGLGEAFEGVALSALARTFGELSDIARRLAEEVGRLDSQKGAG
jgi:excisionase family DNA binding protein